MFETDISKDSYNVLCIIYKVYLQRRKDGRSKDQSTEFSDYNSFKNEYIPDMQTADMHSAIVELKENGYVKLFIDGGFLLTNAGIILMENKFKSNLSDVMDFISKLPFV